MQVITLEITSSDATMHYSTLAMALRLMKPVLINTSCCQRDIHTQYAHAYILVRLRMSALFWKKQHAYLHNSGGHQNRGDSSSKRLQGRKLVLRGHSSMQQATGSTAQDATLLQVPVLLFCCFDAGHDLGGALTHQRTYDIRPTSRLQLLPYDSVHLRYGVTHDCMPSASTACADATPAVRV